MSTAPPVRLGAASQHTRNSASGCAQILKLADDEAAAQKSRAGTDEITKLRGDAQKAVGRHLRAEAKEQSERMLTAAQEQAERTIASSRSDAEKSRTAARAEAERMAVESRKSADNTIAAAKAQAKQMLDEATARASAIHDGAERRLDLLKNRHSEAMRRLTEIRDVVTDLVSHDAAKGTLDEEVEKTVASTLGPKGAPAKPAAGSSPAPKAAPAAQPGSPQPPRPGAAPPRVLLPRAARPPAHRPQAQGRPGRRARRAPRGR